MQNLHHQANETSSPFFGIQFFGECWSGPGDYDRYGISQNCRFIGGAYVGIPSANYVYMLSGEGTCNLRPHKEYSGWLSCFVVTLGTITATTTSLLILLKLITQIKTLKIKIWKNIVEN